MSSENPVIALQKLIKIKYPKSKYCVHYECAGPESWTAYVFVGHREKYCPAPVSDIIHTSFCKSATACGKKAAARIAAQKMLDHLS